MSDENPYSSSVIQAEPPTRRSNQELNDELYGTRPWVLFLSILGFIIGGLMLMAAVFASIAMGIGAGSTGGGAAGLGVAVGVFALYGLFSLLYLVPSYYLYKFGSAIGRIQNQGMEAVVEALASQRKFWKILGVMTVSVILLYILLIGLMFGLGAMGALANF
jgi:hypothetical protein